MKIAHVVDSMEVGGAEILVSQMCRLQRQQGHDPCVYSISTLGPLGEKLQVEDFLVRPHMGRHLSEAMRNLFRAFKESSPDVVHLHNPTPTIYGAFAARMAGVPSIASTRHSLVARPHRVITELKYAIAATGCDWIVGICDATVNNLRSLHTIPAHKIVRVYNGALPLQRVPKEQWPVKSGFTLLYVGRLAPVKNHVLLLNAFREAHLSMPDLRLWMVGDGSERNMLESLAAQLDIDEQVTFWGQQLDVAPFFSAADTFIMSSTSEGLPMSLLQSFSLGLPAIVTNVGGMAEVVRLGNTGIPVSVNNSPEMTSAILRMAGHEAERRHFGLNAEAIFHSEFMLRKMVDSYMDLYHESPRRRHRATI